MSLASVSFVGRGKNLLRQLLAMGESRLKMLGLELEQERLALERELRWAALCALCIWLSGTALIVWIAVALPPPARLWALGILFGLFALTALISFLAFKRASQRERLFGRVAEQLRLDRLALGDEP